MVSLDCPTSVRMFNTQGKGDNYLVYCAQKAFLKILDFCKITGFQNPDRAASKLIYIDGCLFVE